MGRKEVICIGVTKDQKHVLSFKDIYKLKIGVLIQTGKNHGNEMIYEMAIQLRLDRELNPIQGPSGWKPSALPLS